MTQLPDNSTCMTENLHRHHEGSGRKTAKVAQGQEHLRV